MDWRGLQELIIGAIVVGFLVGGTLFIASSMTRHSQMRDDWYHWQRPVTITMPSGDIRQCVLVNVKSTHSSHVMTCESEPQ